uniref:GRIP domain-containing protein n=1 Tax=Eptatretus burgeri TaxID=7764 RepID=A0A8C4N5E8_EPTBU
MFTRLKKRLADEDGMRTSSPSSATRVPRTVSRESLASAGADSGEDSVSSHTFSVIFLSFPLPFCNSRIYKLLNRFQSLTPTTPNLLHIPLAAVTKAQELNELYQVNRARLAESTSLALQEKDNVSQERRELIAKLREAEVLNAFARRDEHDEMSGLQIQEVAKVKHMVWQQGEINNFSLAITKARSEPPCTQESRRVDASTEINLAYLKHVILKFISSRESEAFHLVKAVSVLLQFDADEERLLREMLEYKVVVLFLLFPCFPIMMEGIFF